LKFHGQDIGVTSLKINKLICHESLIIILSDAW